MVVDMYIISPKKNQFKPVFFSLFDFFKMKRPRLRLQKTNKQSFWSWSCLVLVQFGCSLLPVLGLDFQTLAVALWGQTHCVQLLWVQGIQGGLIYGAHVATLETELDVIKAFLALFE